MFALRLKAFGLGKRHDFFIYMSQFIRFESYAKAGRRIIHKGDYGVSQAVEDATVTYGVCFEIGVCPSPVLLFDAPAAVSTAVMDRRQRPRVPRYRCWQNRTIASIS